jgi:hypothetical protein
MSQHSAKPSASDQSQPATLSGKDEMNLAEFPIARLGRNDTRTLIEYHGQIVDKAGNVLEQKWTVSGSTKFGLPTEFSERVLVALMAMTAEDNFAERKVTFTPYRLLKTLGMSTGKVNYQAIKKALQQLVGVTIYSEGSFWDKNQGKRVSTEKGFHLLDDFWLKSMQTESGETEDAHAYIVWGERFWENFKAGYIKNLDVTFYYSLENTLARRLYRFLDKRMHYQNEYQIDIFDLAARLGMKQYEYASEVARKLQPAFSELQERGYLASAEVIKIGKFTRVKFVRTIIQRALQPSLWDNEPEVMAEIASEGRSVSKKAIDEECVTTSQNERLAAFYERHATTESLREAWQGILNDLAATMAAGTYQLIADSALVALQEEVAIIAIPERHRDWVERQMRRKFLARLTLVFSTPVKEIQYEII